MGPQSNLLPDECQKNKKSDQATDLQESEDEAPCYTLAIFETEKLKNSLVGGKAYHSFIEHT